MGKHAQALLTPVVTRWIISLRLTLSKALRSQHSSSLRVEGEIRHMGAFQASWLVTLWKEDPEVHQTEDQVELQGDGNG